jgi:hypothetical protein
VGKAKFVYGIDEMTDNVAMINDVETGAAKRLGAQR